MGGEGGSTSPPPISSHPTTPSPPQALLREARGGRAQNRKRHDGALRNSASFGDLGREHPRMGGRGRPPQDDSPCLSPSPSTPITNRDCETGRYGAPPEKTLWGQWCLQGINREAPAEEIGRERTPEENFPARCRGRQKSPSAGIRAIAARIVGACQRKGKPYYPRETETNERPASTLPR